MPVGSGPISSAPESSTCASYSVQAFTLPSILLPAISGPGSVLSGSPSSTSALPPVAMRVPFECSDLDFFGGSCVGRKTLFISSDYGREWGSHLPVRVQIGSEISPKIEGRQKCSNGCFSI
jgi:hypothetical protein